MKILILGYSNLAIRKIIPAIKKLKKISFDIASISSSEKNIGHDKWYRDYDKALNNSDATIVYISLVNSKHYLYGMKALNKNKNVIIDKPFSTDFKQTINLLNLAKKKKLLISQALVFNYHKQFTLTKAILKKNKTDINKIIMNFCIPKPNKSNFKLSKKFEGGCFNDMAPYAAAMKRIFLGNKYSYSKLIMKNIKNLNESFSLIVCNKKTEFYGIFSHNSEYKNEINFLSKFYSIDLNRFSAPPSNLALTISYKKRNKIKDILVNKDDIFENFLIEFLKKLKKKRFTYYHDQIKEDSRFIDHMYKRKLIL
jgi:NDP-hexose-3-ketoreductase